MSKPGSEIVEVLEIKISSPIVLSHLPDKKLTLSQLVAVARGGSNKKFARVEIDSDSIDRCKRSSDYISEAVIRAAELSKSAKEVDEIDYRQLIYGVNTGFGNNKDKPINSYYDACRLSENLIYSHVTAVGSPLSTEISRSVMLIRLRAFVDVSSGVSPELICLLRDLLNNCVHPLIPSQGSLGSSGDLCQLAHLAVVMIGGGKAFHEPDFISNKNKPAELLSGLEALESADLKLLPTPENLADNGDRTIHLAPKEGLALTNGAAVSAAMTALSVFNAAILLKTANIIGSLSLQSLGGFSRAFDPKVHKARPYKGQISVAADINKYIEGSNLINAAAEGHHQQDEYSIRAIPQVHGAVLDAIDHCRKLIEIEINSATDNPLIFIEPEDISHEVHERDKVSYWETYSAANFHGEPVGLAADYLKIAVAEIGNISERRMQLLLDTKNNRGMPSNLSSGEGGLDSGLMLYQYTAASLVSENKVLCHPSSVDSIPTSANIEDHNAMSTTASRHLTFVVKNVTTVLAAELLVALQALDLRISGKYPITSHSGKILNQKYELNDVAKHVYQLIRNGSEDETGISFIGTDLDFYSNPPNESIEKAARIIHMGKVVLAVT